MMANSELRIVSDRFPIELMKMDWLPRLEFHLQCVMNLSIVLFNSIRVKLTNKMFYKTQRMRIYI